MKDIVIVGASGMGKEVAWLIENINCNNETWNIIGFIDDDPALNDINTIFRYPFLGSSDWLQINKKDVFVTIAIGKGRIRKKVQEKLMQFDHIKFATLVDPSVRIDKTVSIGDGSIICRNCSITVDITIGKGVLLNVNSLIGHDARIGDFCTFLPYSMAAGSVEIGECCEVGSGAFIIQGAKIVENTIIAPLSAVYKDITNSGMYIGNPARQMR